MADVYNDVALFCIGQQLKKLLKCDTGVWLHGLSWNFARDFIRHPFFVHWHYRYVAMNYYWGRSGSFRFFCRLIRVAKPS